MTPCLVWSLAGSLDNIGHYLCACLPREAVLPSLITYGSLCSLLKIQCRYNWQCFIWPGLLLWKRLLYRQTTPRNRFSLCCIHRTGYQNERLLFVELNLAKANFLNFLQNLIHASLWGIWLFFTLLQRKYYWGNSSYPWDSLDTW